MPPPYERTTHIHMYASPTPGRVPMYQQNMVGPFGSRQRWGMNTVTVDPMPDLAGRLALVTGASSGLGLGLATRLAAAGAEVLLGVRDEARGQSALDRLRREVSGARVSLRTLDLASLRSVAERADGLLGEGRPLDILINNAGVMAPPVRHNQS